MTFSLALFLIGLALCMVQFIIFAWAIGFGERGHTVSIPMQPGIIGFITIAVSFLFI